MRKGRRSISKWVASSRLSRLSDLGASRRDVVASIGGLIAGALADFGFEKIFEHYATPGADEAAVGACVAGAEIDPVFEIVRDQIAMIWVADRPIVVRVDVEMRSGQITVFPLSLVGDAWIDDAGRSAVEKTDADFINALRRRGIQFGFNYTRASVGLRRKVLSYADDLKKRILEVSSNIGN